MVSIILVISGLMAIILGIIILFVPKVLNYAVAIYLIFIGIIQLMQANIGISLG
jgi:hypothetical protein